MSQLNNAIIQVRAKLRQLDIKLWLEPYYYQGIGPVEVELERLAEDLCNQLGISKSLCNMALEELQDKAVRKLAANKEFQETRIATFNIRHIDKSGTQSVQEVKCHIDYIGSELFENIAKELKIKEANRIKCIAAGKIVDKDKTLSSQGLTNNQHLLVVVSEIDPAQGNTKDAMYDRVYKIKKDVETLVDSKRQLVEMEDQDGNPVFLPPNENRALLIGMGLSEKARVALKREQYDEALLLLLEADEKFSTCNSNFLENVDNYALLNLDIVWCYLCLKNVTQLPDAERRLNVCEKILERNYGPNFSRVIKLKGNAAAEKAIMMRLHLLQGVVHFHQNERDAAYNKLFQSSSELRELKVDENQVQTLVEMGYEPAESLVALRCCSGNIERAINYIHEQRDKLETNRRKAEKARDVGRNLKQPKEDKDWVNPRSIVALMDMGFPRDLVVEALKRAENSVPLAVEMLQMNREELESNLPPSVNPDSNLINQLKTLGFNEELVRLALETNHNDIEKSVDFLLKMFNDENDLLQTVQRVSEQMEDSPSGSSLNSSSVASLAKKILKKASKEMESLKAFERFNQDLDENDFNYLDLPLVQEEQILAEYMNLLEK